MKWIQFLITIIIINNLKICTIQTRNEQCETVLAKAHCVKNDIELFFNLTLSFAAFVRSVAMVEYESVCALCIREFANFSLKSTKLICKNMVLCRYLWFVWLAYSWCFFTLLFYI